MDKQLVGLKEMVFKSSKYKWIKFQEKYSKSFRL